MSGVEPGDGLIRWRDLDQHREQETNARHGLDERWGIRHQALEARVNSIESVLDQQRGAKALIYFLIGSNLLAVGAFALGLMR